jgi:hypothetical protein
MGVIHPCSRHVLPPSLVGSYIVPLAYPITPWHPASVSLVLLGQKLLAEALCCSDERLSRFDEFLNLYHIRGDKILVIAPVSEMKSDVQIPGLFPCEEPWPNKLTVKQCDNS